MAGAGTGQLTDTAIWRLMPDPQTDPLSDTEMLDLYAPPEAPLFTRANFISSADGAATVGGKSGGLNSPSDKRVFDLLRVVCDAVVVGAGTLREEGYGPMVADPDQQAARVRAGRSAHPALVAVSRRLDLDPQAPMFVNAPVQPYVLTCESSPVAVRERLSDVATVLVAGTTTVDFAAAWPLLAGAGLDALLCEGGPHLLGSLGEAGLLNELCLTLAPKLAGPGAGRIVAGDQFGPVDMTLMHVLHSARGELFLRYAR